MRKQVNEPIRHDISHLRIPPQDKVGRTTGRLFYFIILACCVLTAAIAVVLYWRWSIITVEVVAAEQIDGGKASTVLNASGYVTPRRRATIASKITGQLTEVLVEEGMHVRQGQVLARFDDTHIIASIKTLEVEVMASEAAIAEIDVNLGHAKRNLERNRQLFQTNIISSKDMDDAETLHEGLVAKRSLARKQLDVSRTRLSQMKQELIDYTITAPFSGIVVSKDAQVGEIVSPVSAGGGFTRTGIATIVDMDSLEIEVDVNESFIAKVKSGQSVTATLDAYPDWPIAASVRTVIPTADRQKATVKVRISFDKLDPKILPDMGVKVAFLDSAAASDNTGRNPVRIPLAAVRKEADRQVVFVYKDGTVESRAVRTGSVSGQSVDIVAGVLPGERVAVGNIAALSDGDKVRLAEH